MPRHDARYEYQKRYKAENAEKVKARDAAWRAANRDKVNAKARAWRARHPESSRASVRRHREKNPVDYSREHLKRREKLAGRPKPLACEACGNGDDRICWDHDHATGAFRGWLCEPCNKALGMARDDISRLRALVIYLEKSGE